MDLMAKLQHDHAPLGEGIRRLRRLVNVVHAGERTAADVREDFVETAEQVQDEMLEHFGEEEEVIFPFLRETLPGHAEALGRLEAGHDQIAGALSRLLSLANRSDGEFDRLMDTVRHVFERLEESYTEHAATENDVLVTAAKALTPEQRAALAEAADGLL